MVLAHRREGISTWHPASILATWFGTGLLPGAPGTWGSAAALPFAWILASWGGMWAMLAASLICFLVGWWASAIYVRRSGIDDPGEIVIDEVAAQWLVLAFVPPDLFLYAIGFALFRVLDITKPWPAGWADRHVEGGLGVMIDDTLVALYGTAAMVALAAWWL